MECSNCVKIKSLPWKLLRFLVVIFCGCGFSYQTYTFMKIYWAYPTIVDVRITNPNTVDLPAVTVCDDNGVMSSKFCKKFPDQCGSGESYKSFCEDHETLCDPQKTFDMEKPTIDYRYLPVTTRREYRYLGPEDTIDFTDLSNWDGDDSAYEEQRWVGVVDTQGFPISCYSLNTLWGNITREPLRISKASEFYIDLLLDEHEKFYTSTSSSFHMAIHDPRSVVNPYSEGFSLQAGRKYGIYVKQTVKHLLKAPYSTNCTDYHELWYANGGRGALSSKQCIEQCIKNMTIEDEGCAHRYSITLNESEKFCYLYLPRAEVYGFSSCMKRCPLSCHVHKYHADIEDEGPNDLGYGYRMFAELHISFARFEVITYSYTSKYEVIELFSYIGGYMGMWLGVSLIAVFDFVKAMWFITRNPCTASRQMFERQYKKTRVKKIGKRLKKAKKVTQIFNIRRKLF